MVLHIDGPIRAAVYT